MATLTAGFTAVNGDTVNATYLNNFLNTGTVTLSATDRLLGRVSPGSGAMEEVAFTDFAQALVGQSSAANALTLLGIGAGGTFSGLSVVSSDQYRFVPNAIPYAASVNLDFSVHTVQPINLAGNVTFTTSNLAVGRVKLVWITADASFRTLTFPSEWVAIGSSLPSLIPAGKIGRLFLECLGTADSDVRASYSVQP